MYLCCANIFTRCLHYHPGKQFMINENNLALLFVFAASHDETERLGLGHVTCLPCSDGASRLHAPGGRHPTGCFLADISLSPLRRRWRPATARSWVVRHHSLARPIRGRRLLSAAGVSCLKRWGQDPYPSVADGVIAPVLHRGDSTSLRLSQ